MPSLYPATREQTIYGPKTRQLSKNAGDPNSGKCGRDRETMDIGRENMDIYNFHQGKYGQCIDLLHR